MKTSSEKPRRQLSGANELLKTCALTPISCFLICFPLRACMFRITELWRPPVQIFFFSNPTQIQPSCQMDSCTELNLSSLGLDGNNRKALGRVRMSGLGTVQTIENNLAVDCLQSAQMLRTVSAFNWLTYITLNGNHVCT